MSPPAEGALVEKPLTGDHPPGHGLMRSGLDLKPKPLTGVAESAHTVGVQSAPKTHRPSPSSVKPASPSQPAQVMVLQADYGNAAIARAAKTGELTVTDAATLAARESSGSQLAPAKASAARPAASPSPATVPSASPGPAARIQPKTPPDGMRSDGAAPAAPGQIPPSSAEKQAGSSAPATSTAPEAMPVTSTASGPTSRWSSKGGDVTTAPGAIGAERLRSAADTKRPAAPPTPPPPIHLDSSSSAHVIDSLSGVPPSLFPQALGQAGTAAAGIQSAEKSALAASYPEIEKPSGLARTAKRAAASHASLKPGSAPALPAGGAGAIASPHVAVQPNTPVPGSQVATTVAEPASETGSWWDWLTGAVRTFLANLPTSDTGLSTSAGLRPNVPLGGDSDPTRVDRHLDASHSTVLDHRSEANAAATADFGENDINPTLPGGLVRPGYMPSKPAAGKTGPRQAVGANSVVRAQFDAERAPWLEQQVQQRADTYRKDQEKQRKDSNAARTESNCRIAEESARTRKEQQTIQQQAKADVQDGRARWRQENAAGHAKYTTQSESKRLETNRQIQEKVTATEQQASDRLNHAERESDVERIKAEAQAEAQKREAQNRPRSVWEELHGAVSRAFAAITQAITGVFEALRRTVARIIQKARDWVHGIIEAARTAIVGFIRTFGDALKALVSAVLFAFPDIAARARAWIDQKVEQATTAVNNAAAALERVADAILNALAKGLDGLLSALQAVFNALLNALEGLVHMILDGLELLQKIQEFLQRFLPTLKRITDLINDPTPAIEAIKAYFGAQVDKIPDAAQALAERAITFSPPPPSHWLGIKAHLMPKVQYLKDNWWQLIKDTAWLLLWPFGKDSSGKRPLFKDAQAFWKLAGDAGDSISKGQYSKAGDQFLKMLELANNILGMFYGWIFIALVIGGGILGAEAGVVPGMVAGAALALEIGEALLIVTAVIEGSVLLKSGYNLVFRHQTPEENDEDYERIAGSSLTLAILGALVLLGAAAARFGKAILRGAGRAVSAVIRFVLGPRAASIFEAAISRIRARIAAFVELLRTQGKFKLKGSGVTVASYEGPAVRLHPERFEQIINDLERNHVDINVRDAGNPWEAAYGPGGKGKPGSLNVHKDVDLRTLEHEYQHFLDDQAGGYPGARFYFTNPEVQIDMERAAYNREIELVKADPSLSPEEKIRIAGELEESFQNEKKKILGSTGE